MTRIALYARYSSENQRDASIEDQLRQCRERAAREGWTVVETYCDRAISGIMTAIEDGLYQPSMKARMNELELEKAEITTRMAETAANAPDVHPNIAEVYRRNVERFTEALNDPYGGREAAEALRSLIGEIVLTPGERRGEVHAELRGELMGILAFATDQKASQTIRFMPPVASSA